MINITEEQKALFLRDSVPKQFVVAFPNGEYPNITNEQIMADSVSFTESLCSQDTFKLGLCEASTISFTAMNVPNIKGTVIKCSIIADGFEIVYGTFKVDSCPLNDDGSRTITGYSLLGNGELGVYMKCVVSGRSSTPDAFVIGADQFHYINNAIGNDYRDASLAYASVAVSSTTPTFAWRTMTGQGKETLNVRLTYSTIPSAENGSVYQYSAPMLSDSAINAVRSYFNTSYKNGYTNALSILESLESILINGYDMSVMYPCAQGIASYAFVQGLGVTVRGVVTAIQVVTTGGQTRYSRTFRTGTVEAFKVTGFSNIGTVRLPRIKNVDGQYVIDLSTFSMTAFNIAFAENKGAMGRIDRETGAYDLFTLSREAVAEAIPSSRVMSIELDEYGVDNVSTVNVRFIDANGEEIVTTVTSGEDIGMSYTVSNYLTQQSLTQAEAESIGRLVLNGLNGISYMPMVLKTKGMPYLETGDRISVAYKGETYETLVLRRTIDGITHLADTIVACQFYKDDTYSGASSSSSSGGTETPYPGDAYINRLIDARMSSSGLFIDPSKVTSVGSGTTYTAPYNGILYFQGATGLSVSLDGVQVIGGGGSTQSGVLMLPMKSGQVMTSTKSLSQMFFCGTF